ncbi:hypothetical protein VTI74DRAFT_2789 [Chaetomium olivicolor]
MLTKKKGSRISCLIVGYFMDEREKEEMAKGTAWLSTGRPDDDGMAWGWLAADRIPAPPIKAPMCLLSALAKLLIRRSCGPGRWQPKKGVDIPHKAQSTNTSMRVMLLTTSNNSLELEVIGNVVMVAVGYFLLEGSFSQCPFHFWILQRLTKNGT